MSGISDEKFAERKAWYDSEPEEWKDLYEKIDALPPRDDGNAIPDNDPAWLAAMRAPVLRDAIPEQERLDMEELAALDGMTPEERKARAKAWLESRPDWMREGIEEARKQEAEWLAIRPPNYGREISKEEWGKLIDGAPEKWKKLFERLKQRRLAEQGDPSRKSAAPNDPLIAFVKSARQATVPMTDNERRGLERFRARKAELEQSVLRRGMDENYASDEAARDFLPEDESK